MRSLTADDVRQFFAAHYTSEASTVAVAGDVDHDDIVAKVAAAFADLPAGDGRIARTPPTALGESVQLDDDSEQVHLAFGGRALRRDHPDREALDVVNHAFGGGLSSRLFDEIRERRGLAYSIYSATSAYCDTGAWSVYAGAMPEHAGEVHRVVLEELDRLVADGLTEDELAIAVGYLTGAYEMGLEDTGARMGRLGGMLATLGKVHTVEEQLARWERVIARRREAASSATSTGPPTRSSSASDRSTPDPGVLGNISRRIRGRTLPGVVCESCSVIRVGVNGACGRMGRAACAAVAGDGGLELVAAVSPRHVGEIGRGGHGRR